MVCRRNMMQTGRGIGGSGRPALAMSFATMFALGITISLLGPSLPGLAARTGASLAHAGILFTLFGLGSLCSTLALSLLVDRPVRHLLLVGGALLSGVALWLLSLSQTLPQAGVAVALAGLGMSTMGTSPNAVVAEHFDAHAGRALNALHLAAGVGSFVGPLLVGLAIRLSGDYRAGLAAAGTFEIGLGLLWILAPPARPRRVQLGAPRSRPGRLAPLALLLLLAGLYVGTEQTFSGWIFSYGLQAISLDVATASLAAALFWLAVLMGRLAATQALRYASNLVLLGAAVAAGVAGVVAVVAAGPGSALLWLGIGLAGLGMGPVFPTLLAEGARLAPLDIGMVSSLVVAAGSAGAMVLPWASGQLIAGPGIRATIAACLLFLALMAAGVYALGRPQPRPPR
jgi:FHS family Na+ dependent glucose MFS transporter 1